MIFLARLSLAEGRALLRMTNQILGAVSKRQ